MADSETFRQMKWAAVYAAALVHEIDGQIAIMGSKTDNAERFARARKNAIKCAELAEELDQDEQQQRLDVMRGGR